MARSPDDLPEGTDSIINDDLIVDGADPAFGVEDDFDSADAAPGFADTPIGGGAAAGIGAGAGASAGAGAENVKQKFADATAGLKEQAAEKARAYAAQGKDKATGALDNLARMVNEAADNVDQQIGPQYGAYARQAADMVSNFSSSLQEKDVDALVSDASDLVRKSPAIAIGAAAALGFVLVRLVKSGIETADTTGTPSSDTPSGNA
jgi:ElaB/YqjD/DUF883 family membrane-anchored ribosome-binding protein